MAKEIDYPTRKQQIQEEARSLKAIVRKYKDWFILSNITIYFVTLLLCVLRLFGLI